MAGVGAVLCIFWYQVGVKYHPTPLGAVKKMMRSNAESLMAGAGAIYLYFDTESMQNIIQSLIGSGVAVMKRMRSPLSSVHWTSRAATLIRGKFPMELRTYTTRNQIILTKQSGRVTKILTASKILQISIALCQIKAKIHSFPTMYIIGGGVNLV